MSTPAFHIFNDSSFETDINVKLFFDLIISILSITTLTIFITTKTYQLIFLIDQCSVFNATTYLFDLMPFLAQSFNSSWNDNKLLSVSYFFTWFYIVTRLKISTCSPAEDYTLVI